jgi:hypothetical protein
VDGSGVAQMGGRQHPCPAPHLGNLAVVQDHAADELHVKRPQAQHAARALANDLRGVELTSTAS